jgi:hypothetical protein
MKNRLTLILFIFVMNFGFSQTNDSFFKNADVFFKNYVIDGKIDYKTIAKSGKLELESLINFLANNTYSENIKKAYLINAYNLLVIDQIISHYPISTPMEISGFFENKNSILNGKMIALNTLENNELRKFYKDPRFHFVLVCGGLGCPPIINSAYTPSNLEDQLETQTLIALNNSEFVYQNDNEKTIYLSEIFSWYSTDFGQNDKAIITYINKYRNKTFSVDYKIKNYPYDWSLNESTNKEEQRMTLGLNTVVIEPIIGGQTFNAGSLLRKGQFDFTLFNTMYTQTEQEWQGQKILGPRATFNTYLVQITYGNSKSKRINIGLDLYLKSSGSSTDLSFNGVSSAFKFTNTDSTRAGLASIGLKLKFQPFKTVSNFTGQSAVIIPTTVFPEGNTNLYWSDWDRITWWNQFFYTKSFSKFQLFTEFDMLFRFKKHKEQINALDIPLSVFFSYFPTKKITVYAMSQHVPRFTDNKNPTNSTDWIVGSSYTASGVGFKYQFNRGLNLELLYSNFWRGANSGLGSTFNIGIKYITK